ncbi:MAG: protein-L-isoaspartate(D-aspartate) O-methyltransferase [Bryobacterales bacterium]|nr:protein-L-isoaspartate(D-aspartate) O-methyltransferase [Bryobacterales bacterium]
MRVWIALFGAALLLAANDPFAARRETMVRQQIQARGVRNPAVLKAMRETPRHLFVPALWRAKAYDDQPLPISHGQTISQPYIVAAMTDLLDVDPAHRVLEIGTGSGYQAAVLSGLVKQVFTMEVVPELAETSRALLQQLGYANVQVKHGDGYLGWPEEAPFDRIIVTAAPPEIPQALIDQLKVKGKLVAPVGRSPMDQQLIVLEKDDRGRVRRRTAFPVRFVPMVPKR